MLLGGCVKITFGEYLYTYKIETQSPRVVAIFRHADGRVFVDTIKRVASTTFGNWTYGFEGKTANEKYYIKVKNDTAYGYTRVTVLLNSTVLKEDIRRDSVVIINL
jgi:hypothetical protein